MNQGRRAVAAVAAVTLAADAVVIGTVQLILGTAVDRQDMTLAGISSTALSTVTIVGGVLTAALLLLCCALLARAAVTDRPPRRAARLVLVSAAVLHCVLGAVVAAVVSWLAFAALMAVFGLLVLTLTMYPPGMAGEPASGPQIGDGDPEPGEQAAQQGQGQADHGARVPVDAVDERGAAAVQREGPGDVERFARGDVGGDLRVTGLPEADRR